MSKNFGLSLDAQPAAFTPAVSFTIAETLTQPGRKAAGWKWDYLFEYLFNSTMNALVIGGGATLPSFSKARASTGLP